MKCNRCNIIVSDNSSVCPHCGNKLLTKIGSSNKGASNKYIKNSGAELVGSEVTKSKGTITKISKRKESTKYRNTTKGSKNKYITEDSTSLVGGIVTKNNGSITKIGKKKENVKYRKTTKGSKNKYLTEDNSSLVGGVVSKGNGTFIKLEKKSPTSVSKKVKTIDRKNYNNYIDYKEAKERLEEQLIRDSLKDVKSFNEKDMSGKVVPSNKVNFSSKIGWALLKKPDFGVNENSGAKLSQKPTNNIVNIAGSKSQSSKFFNYDDNSNKSSFNTINIDSKNGKRNFKKESNFLSYAVVLALWIIAIILLVNNTNSSFYFKQGNNYVENTESSNGFEEYKGVSKSGQSGGSTSEGYTSIVYDNQYLSQFTIRTEQDVYNLISTDSMKQKNNCPNNIKEIEDSIIKKYGITAVNLCEMDEDFALELANVVKYIYNEFPSARNYLTNLTLANVGDNNTFIAAFMPIFTFSTSNSTSGYPVATKTQIILNAKYFLNSSKIKNSVSYGSKSGYFPPNATRSSTVAHEFGHYLSYVALLNYYETDQLNYVRANESSLLYDVYDDFNAGSFSRKLLEEAFDNYVIETGSTESFYEFRASISQYAIAKDVSGAYIYDETIAEAFHDFYLNGSNAKLASLSIVKVLRSKL
ncbi:MAG: hypothetical protein ACI4XM_01765 [Candidatus Coprovivens sp.]